MGDGVAVETVGENFEGSQHYNHFEGRDNRIDGIYSDFWHKNYYIKRFRYYCTVSRETFLARIAIMATKFNSEAVAIALLAAFEIPNFYSGLLPSEMTIRRFAAEQADRQTLQNSVIVATALSVGVVGTASYVAKSWLPVLMGGVIMGVLIYRYESAINNPHANATPINQQPGM